MGRAVERMRAGTWGALTGISALLGCGSSAPQTGFPPVPALSAWSPSASARGIHCEVFCYFPSPKAARQALQAAETAWTIAAELYGTPAGSDRDPLVRIYLYPDERLYCEADAALTGGALARNQAFAHYPTRTAHLALQPAINPLALETLGLPCQTVRLLCHETAHLARDRLLPDAGRHPKWFIDGMASWIDQQAMRTLGCIVSPEEDPFLASEIRDGRALLEAGKLPPVPEILKNPVQGIIGPGEQYSVRTLFTRFLFEKHPEEARRTVREIGHPPASGKEMEARLAALDGAFREYVASARPRWDEAGRSLETAGQEWVDAAFPDTNAQAWRIEPAGAPPYGLSGSVRILPGAGSQLNLLLDRAADGSFVSVALRAGQDGGTAALFEFRPGDKDPWRRLISADIEGLKTGKTVEFRVQVSRDREVSLELDERPVLKHRLDKRSLSGSWGLGAQAGAVGIWKSIRFESGN